VTGERKSEQIFNPIIPFQRTK